MEPRIPALLDDSIGLDRICSDFPALSWNSCRDPPPRRPHPVEPSHVPSQVTRNFSDGSSRFQYIAIDTGGGDVTASRERPSNVEHHRPNHAAGRREKSGVPLAEVLNQEREPSTTRNGLNNILSNDSPKKKRKVDGNELLTLPRPQPQVGKGSRRQRIPPLLQGLHHPPPNAGLFPPITEKNIDSPHDDIAPQTSPNPIQAPSRPADRPTVTTQHPPEAESPDKPFYTPKPPKPKNRDRRRRWTDEETAHLLRGVARFGIGNWKKIAQCPDYEFNDRTPVDLKDRFRTCCPDDYRTLKVRENQPQSKGDSTEPSQTAPVSDKGSSTQSNESSGQVTQSATRTGEASGEGPVESTEKADSSNTPGPRANRSSTKNPRKTKAELAELGIEAPFSRLQRRERQLFSEEEDKALLRGFEKHGSKWNDIRNDSELKFEKRQPTDLRDRFRNRYPLKYKEAGYKIRRKKLFPDTPDQRRMIMKRVEAELAQLNDEPQAEPAAIRVPSLRTNPSASGPGPGPGPGQVQGRTTGLSNSLRPLTSNFPELSLIDDSFADSDGASNPITLNRNIFQWADANCLPSLTQSSTHLESDAPQPAHIATVSGMDQLHINPLAMNIDPSPKARQMQSQALSRLPLLTLPSTSAGTSGSFAPSRSAFLGLPPASNLISGLDEHASGPAWDESNI